MNEHGSYSKTLLECKFYMYTSGMSDIQTYLRPKKNYLLALSRPIIKFLPTEIYFFSQKWSENCTKIFENAYKPICEPY